MLVKVVRKRGRPTHWEDFVSRPEYVSYSGLTIKCWLRWLGRGADLLTGKTS